MILIPLGTIVKCNTKNSIIEFQKIINNLGFKYSVTTLLPQLTTLIEKFNQGLVTEEEFLCQIFDNILNKAKELEQKIPDLTSEQTQEIKQQLLAAWNSQAEIDQQALELIGTIQELQQKGNKIVIYSGTNESHFTHQVNIFTARGIHLDEENIHTTFKYKTNKSDLVKVLLDMYKVNAKNPCIIAVGNPTEYLNFLQFIIDDCGALEKMERSKIEEINSLKSKETGVYIEQLNGDATELGSRLTKENLAELLTKMQEILEKENKSHLTKKPKLTF